MIEITTEPLIASSGNCGVHESTDWQIATDSDFNNVIHESLNDTVNLNSYTYNDGIYYPNLYARVRYRTTSCLTNWATIVLTEEETFTSKIATPAVSYDIGDNKITASEFMLLDNVLDSHVSTDWEVKNINNVPIFQSLNDTVNLEEITLPPNTIDPNESYAITVRYNGYHNKSLIGGIIAPVDHTGTMPNPSILTPNLIVQGELNNVSETPILTSTPFSMAEGNDTHQSTDWMLYMSIGGSETLAWSAIGSTGAALTSIQIPSGVLYNGPEWIFRIRHNGAFTSSDWGEKRIFEILSPLDIVAPTLSSTIIYNNKVPTNPILYTTPFETVNGNDVHVATSWIAEILNNGLWIQVWSNLNSNTDLVGTELPLNALPYNTTVRFRATHHGQSGLSKSSDFFTGITVEQFYTGFRDIANPVNILENPKAVRANNGLVYLTSGVDNGVLSPVTEIYNPDNDNFTTGPNLNIPAANIGLVNIDGILVKFGGNDITLGNPCIGDVEILNTTFATPSWVVVGQMPVEIKQFGYSKLLNNLIFVTGGWSEENTYNISRRTWLYDVLTNTWVRHVDLPDWLRKHGQVTLKTGEVLLIGGESDNGLTHSNRVYRMSVDGVWTTDSFLPQPLRNVKAVVTLDNKVIITEAETLTGSNITEFLIRLPDTGEWITGDSFPVDYPTQHAQTILNDNSILIFSGTGVSKRYYL
jgi:hypothetical protein